MAVNRGSSEPRQPRAEMDNVALSDERRRVARELHDTTSQLLVALQLQLGQLRRRGVSETDPLLDEMEQVIRAIHESIRQVGFRQSSADEGVDAERLRLAKLFYSIANSGVPAR